MFDLKCGASVRTLSVVLALFPSLTASGQFSYPSAASTRLYLGHFIDGGPSEQRWKTTVIFTNPNPNAGAPVKVSFYDDLGQALPLDFGQGASPILNLTIPAGGAKLVTTTGASTTLASGWAIVEALDEPATAPATPVTASVLYRGEVSGNRWWDVATIGTGSTYFYSSYGNGDLGVALANPSRTATIRLEINARNETGQSPAGPWELSLPPLGHKAFNLRNPPTSLDNFSGTIQIKSIDDPPTPFVALSLNYRDPVLSPLPPGETAAPGPHDRRAYDVAVKVRQAGVALMGETDPYVVNRTPGEIAEFIRSIGLTIDPDVPLRATYDSTGKKVHLSVGLIEALGTNDAALAFVIAHMSARAILQWSGMPLRGAYANDQPGLADFVAMATLLKGGFDPGGAADFFGRLIYAAEQGLTVDGPMRNEFAITDGVVLRLEKMAENINATCGAAGMYPICQMARKYWHPHNPASIP